jgi:hypothetical protein
VKTLDKWIQENIRHNGNVNYDHIQDTYFKKKLDDGLIKYAPDEWTELEPREEREIG